MELSNNEQLKLQLGESAKTMASTDFWKLLVKAMINDEINVLAALDNYLALEPHPDREEVMTLCLKWHALRTHRRLFLENVRQACDYKSVLRSQVMEQLMANAEPLSEEAQSILLEYGEQ